LPSRSPSSGGAAAPAPTSEDPSEFQHPTSADELKATFIQAFDAGDKETLEQLFFWGDLAPDGREATHSSMTKDAGVARIVRVDLESRPEPVEDYTISSTTLFEIEYESRAASITISWPFAEVDGKFYFGAWIPKARPERR
jgi:hypothetical protein